MPGGLTAVRTDGGGRTRAAAGLAQEHHELPRALLTRDEGAVRAVVTRHLAHVRDLWAK